MKTARVLSARLFVHDAHPTLEIAIEGAALPLMLHDLKATTLGFGVVPLPLELAEFGDTFGVQPDNDLSDPVVFEHYTNDPVILELARRLHADTLTEGPVVVPSQADASAADWEIDAVRGVFRKKN